MAIGIGGGGGDIGAVLNALRGMGGRWIAYADGDSVTNTKLLMAGLSGIDGKQVYNPISGTTQVWRGSTSGSLNRQVCSRGPAEVAGLDGRVIELWCNSNNGVTGGINSMRYAGHTSGATDTVVARIRTAIQALGAGAGQNIFSTFPILAIRSNIYVPPTVNGGFRYAALGFGGEPANNLASTDPPRCAGFIARDPTGNWNFLVCSVEGGPAELDADSGFSCSVARRLDVRFRQPTRAARGAVEFWVDGALRRVFSTDVNFAAQPIAIIRSLGNGGGAGTGRDGGTVTNPAAVHMSYLEVAEEYI